MSFESWRAEFYPISARTCARDLPDSELVEHSLLKWQGLRHDNLAKHRMGRVDRSVYDTHDLRSMPLNDSTCALCVKHLDEASYTYRELAEVGREGLEPHTCSACPLAKARGGVPCDARAPREGCSPYSAGTCGHDPEPMIAALIRARDFVGAEDKA